MSDTVIKVENLYKEYRLGVVNHGTLRHDLASWWAKTTGKEDPNSLIGKAKNKDQEELKSHFLALNDVSFEVKAGEVLGIIGRNGAGKSTLLKLLSRVTTPSAGSIKIKGKMASLLEVGTGFHPEMTGRENVYMNGAILGMRRWEIARKMEEIVAFAELEKFIDTPVKRYSSGMYVRLAFAVAAHLDADILLMDEVLAVGDATFQKKCLGKMDDVAKNHGRTVLFVSHNMGAVSALCKKGLVLNKGQVTYSGEIAGAVKAYTTDPSQKEQIEWKGLAGDENVKVYHTWLKCLNDQGAFHTASDIEVGIDVEVLRPLEGLILGFTLFSEFGYELAYVLFDDEDPGAVTTVAPGRMTKKFIIPKNTLAHGEYEIEFDVGLHMHKRIVQEEGKLRFSLVNVSGLGRKYPVQNVRGRSGLFRPKWSVTEL
jgi:lipopolysaccharide transport system ATP-binding protein